MIHTLQRYFFLVVVLILLSFGEILGQEKNVEKFSTPSVNSPGSLAYKGLQAFTQNIKIPINKQGVNNEKYRGLTLLHSPALLTTYTPLSPGFYSNCLGFFCKKELQIEKAIAIPLRFRLGSVQYTDYLEGKPNTRIIANHGF